MATPLAVEVAVAAPPRPEIAERLSNPELPPVAVAFDVTLTPVAVDVAVAVPAWPLSNVLEL
jgi:hypothetical protein